MADNQYSTWPAILKSMGITARFADDQPPIGTYLNMNNVEELEETTMISRLGSTIVNKTGTTVNALAGPAHSLARLVNTTTGTTYRYAGGGTDLYRRTGDTPGPYTMIASSLSGEEWSAVVYRPTLSSFPYIFFADSAKMLKDNGSTTSQQGIFQPYTPVQAQAQAPQLIVLDTFENSTGTYTIVAGTGAATDSRVSTTLTAAITTPGVQLATVASMTNIVPFQLLVINRGGGSQETVLVLSVPYDNAGFYADFTKTHTSGTTVTENYLSISVAASTTATVTSTTGPFNLSVFPNGTLTQGADYIAIFLNVGNPNNISQINLSLDVGDGSFTQDYYTKVILPSIYQDAITQTEDQTTLITQIIYNQAIGVYTQGAASGYQLTTGNNQWTAVLVQMSDFQTVGNAGLDNPGFTMADINAWQVQIVTNTNGSTTIGMDGLICFGGSGPDSFGGVAYDWLYTYYNINTGLESNPCMFMANPQPPQFTYQIIPRRQPVLLTLQPSLDPQVTHFRIYRRGGTLASNFFRVDQIPISQPIYTDQASDEEIEAATEISFTNDVPVTSTLPVPVNSILTIPLTPAGTGELLFVYPLSISNVYPHQQVTIGSDIDPYQETVIVEEVGGDFFTAFIQNAHGINVPITAEAFYGQPCNIAAIAYNCQWLAGDPSNPQYLYYSNAFSPESFSSANYIEVGSPDDPIIAIVPFLGSLYVGTRSTWYGISPSQQSGQAPTVYPTTAVHGIAGSHGWVTTENEIWHQAVDGIRAFAGGSAAYKSQYIEFLFQSYVPGETPIEEANPNLLNQTVMAYWNSLVFIAYTGMDGNRYRLIYATNYNRFRNDSIPAISMFLEKDTNTLLYGTEDGVVHQDRVGTYDEVNVAGQVVNTPLALNLQTPYLDQGAPKVQKQYNELTIDCLTNGVVVTPTLLFNDGEESLTLATFSTTSRQKVNLNINAGLGEQAYRVSLQLTAESLEQVIFYQVAIRGVMLAETRQSFDSYLIEQGTSESKLTKQMYADYTSTAALNFSVYYDQSITVGYSFTLPAAPERISTRVRFPAVKYRLIRVVATSTADFQMWSCTLETKPIVTGKGYLKMPLGA